MEQVAEDRNPRDEAIAASRLWRWQTRLLPFVVGAISLLALFFFVSTFLQLEKLNEGVRFEEGKAISTALEQVDARAAELTPTEATELLKWKTMVVLEADVVRHRYHQVNATLQMRAWTRHMGFITGMMMAFVGSIFILSKLSEAPTQLAGEGHGLKASLATSSPGIVLATLGTALMLVTLVANYSFTTADIPVYLGAQSGSLPEPQMIDDPASNAAEQRLFGGNEGGGGNEVSLDPQPAEQGR